ncbi:hypothetical protein NM208_g6541 [Fusarium decemcellulare]|uniref:Uncharacterized protein n=1 Tax=Fusarium decemcellulare TaxID=57161 RepID=A0ACC1SCM2_9HYPO|nr:hypothetical protein NM208_g6541 [Fusarium decemcellulare]
MAEQSLDYPSAQTIAAASRKRAARACKMCHVRKIRCDATLQDPGNACSYCKSLGVACHLSFSPSGRDGRRRNAGRHGANPSQSRSRPQTIFNRITPATCRQSGPQPDSDTSEGQLAIPSNESETLPDSASRVYGATNPKASSIQQETMSNRQHSFIITEFSLFLGIWPTSVLIAGAGTSRESNVWTLPLEQIQSMGETNNYDLHAGGEVDHGEGANNISMASKPNRRYIYSSNIVTNSVLPHMTGHRSFRSQGENPTTTLRPNAQPEEFIKLPVSHIPNSMWYRRQLTTAPFDHLPGEDVAYLCEVKNCLHFPSPDVVLSFFECFIRHFLPAFPVVDRTQLQNLYNELMADDQVSSPLLLHAILFDACQYAPPEALKLAGFSSRLHAKTYFHHRASLLYFFDCEKEQVVLLQALIFMSPWWTAYGQEKETRFWITCSINLAFSMGLHRTIPSQSQLSSNERSLWRRIFWTIFMRDVNIAIGLGRPPIINVEDVDVELLSETDFYEASSHADKGVSSWPLDCTGHQRNHAMFLIEMARLSQILAQVLKTQNASGSSAQQLDLLASLRTKVDRNQSPAFAFPPAPISLGNDTMTMKDDSPIWAVSLEINRERILALIHRMMHGHIEQQESNTAVNLKLVQNRQQIVRCASNTVTHFEHLLSLDLLKNTSLFAALVTHLEEVKNNPPQSRNASLASNKIQLGILILDEMRKYWSQAEWAYELVKFCSDRDFDILRHLPRTSRWQSPLSPRSGIVQSGPIPDIDLADLVFPDASIFEMQQWFGDTRFDGLVSQEQQGSGDF